MEGYTYNTPDPNGATPESVPRTQESEASWQLKAAEAYIPPNDQLVVRHLGTGMDATAALIEHNEQLLVAHRPKEGKDFGPSLANRLDTLHKLKALETERVKTLHSYNPENGEVIATYVSGESIDETDKYNEISYEDTEAAIHILKGIHQLGIAVDHDLIYSEEGFGWTDFYSEGRSLEGQVQEFSGLIAKGALRTPTTEQEHKKEAKRIEKAIEIIKNIEIIIARDNDVTLEAYASIRMHTIDMIAGLKAIAELYSQGDYDKTTIENILEENNSINPAFHPYSKTPEDEAFDDLDALVASLNI